MEIIKKFRLAIKSCLGALIIIAIYFYNIQNLDENDIYNRYNVIKDSLIVSNIKQNHVTNTLSITGIQSITTQQSDLEVVMQQTIDNQITKIVGQSVLPTHGVGDDLNYTQGLFDNICKYNKQYCNLTVFEGNFSIKEQIKYQSIVIYVIKKLDKFLGKDKFLDNLYTLRLIKNGQDRRGLAGHHSISISFAEIKNNQEFFEVLTHELGHIMDLGIINGTDNSDYSNVYTEFGNDVFKLDDRSLNFYAMSWFGEDTRRGNTSIKDFVSGYAMSDPFEDFAESFNMYLNHYHVFKKMSDQNYIIGQKFQFIDSIFGGKYMIGDYESLSKLSSNLSRRPWDTTKIK